MKATLTPEARIFTLDVKGRTIPGMREIGQLGPVLHLKSNKGHEAYIYDGSSPLAEAFRLFGDEARSVTLIAGNAAVIQAIHAPETTPEPWGD